METFIVLIIVIAGIIGIVYKSTYDNPLADEKSFDKISVSLFEERNIGIIEGTLAGTIKDETQYVYKIVITEDYEFDFQSLTQKAKILEVFKGDGVVGDEITIYDSCWHLFDDKCILLLHILVIKIRKIIFQKSINLLNI